MKRLRSRRFAQKPICNISFCIRSTLMSITFGVQDVRSFEALASNAVPPVYLSSRGNYYSNYQQALDDERREAKPAAQPAPQQQTLQYPPQPLALGWQPRMEELGNNINHVAAEVLLLAGAVEKDGKAINQSNRAFFGRTALPVVPEVSQSSVSRGVVRALAARATSAVPAAPSLSSSSAPSAAPAPLAPAASTRPPAPSAAPAATAARSSTASSAQPLPRAPAGARERLRKSEPASAKAPPHEGDLGNESDDSN